MLFHQQPVEILEIICWSVDPDTQYAIRRALRCTCRRFYQKVKAAITPRADIKSQIISLYISGATLPYIRKYYGTNLDYLVMRRVSGGSSVHNYYIICANRLDLLKEQPISSITIDDCCTAARIGNLQCLQYMRKTLTFAPSVLRAAALKGHLDCMRFAYENGSRFGADLCEEIAIKGYVDCLRFAHENGAKWSFVVCRKAAENGRLDCLRYAHVNGCPLDIPNPSAGHYNTCQNAASNGHLGCLRYCHENGIILNKWVASNAAAGGHLDCLRYIHESGAVWSITTHASAAGYGHLDCLRYAHENGCAWDQDVWSNAGSNGHLHCLKYAHENNCPRPHNLCDHIVYRGKLDCLKFCHQTDSPITPNTCKIAIKQNELACLKYIRKSGIVFNDYLLRKAKSHGNSYTEVYVKKHMKRSNS